MNNSTIPGSTDATGLFTANPNYFNVELTKSENKLSVSSNAHPPLFCYNENNKLVKGVEGLEVTGPYWQYEITGEPGHWFTTKNPSGGFKGDYSIYSDYMVNQCGCLQTRQVYIAVQPTEKASVSNVEEIENSVRELINSLPGYEANVKLQQFYKAIYEAGRKQGAADQEKLIQGEWIPISNPPKKDGVYLVWGSIYADTPRKALRCNYYKKVFKSDSGNGVKTKNITHWMPLPSAPKL